MREVAADIDFDLYVDDLSSVDNKGVGLDGRAHEVPQLPVMI